MPDPPPVASSAARTPSRLQLPPGPWVTVFDALCARFPAIAEHLARLRQYAPQAMMTGSGACVFAAFTDDANAMAVFRRLPQEMNGWLAAGLAEHPLAFL